MNELKTILCVDDDDDILEITSICLSNVGGYTVFTCSSGTEAIDRIREIKPDIVLLDVMMPEMDGPTVIKHLQADPELHHVPVVFMTARVQEREVDNYLGLGAIAVISKPFDPLELSNEVAAAWLKSRSASAAS